MEDAINEAFFEFSLVIQTLVKAGWTVGEISYGEKRLSIGPSIKVCKGDVTHICYCRDDFDKIAERERRNAALHECIKLRNRYKETNSEADKKAFWDAYYRSGMNDGGTSMLSDEE